MSLLASTLFCFRFKELLYLSSSSWLVLCCKLLSCCPCSCSYSYNAWLHPFIITTIKIRLNCVDFLIVRQALLLFYKRPKACQNTLNKMAFTILLNEIPSFINFQSKIFHNEIPSFIIHEKCMKSCYAKLDTVREKYDDDRVEITIKNNTIFSKRLNFRTN